MATLQLKRKITSCIGRINERLFVRAIQILIEDLGHREHVYAILFENSAHGVVATDLTSVVWILQIVFTNILPESLYCLRTRKLLND
jgi:hypothetical protein